MESDMAPSPATLKPPLFLLISVSIMERVARTNFMGFSLLGTYFFSASISFSCSEIFASPCVSAQSRDVAA
jgi:hypothetical protein